MTKNIEKQIIEIIEKMIEESELDIETDINYQTKLIENLGLNSVDFVELFVRIEDTFKQKLGFHDLIMVDGKYVDDLTLEQLINYVQRAKNNQLNINNQQLDNLLITKTETPKINQQQITQFIKNIPEPPLINTDLLQKNPPVVFLLSPSRSGSTLLRVILAGHPQIFAPPELHLLSFDTLQRRKKALDNDENRHLLDGTIRAIMRSKNFTSEEAQKLMNYYEDKNISTKDFYLLLQQWIDPQILVDKTPSYSYHLNFLKAAEAQFSNPIYIHLLRHPYGVIHSFEEGKMDQFLPFMQSNQFTRQQYAELAWLVCQKNITTFLNDIPPQRQIKIKYEDLVTIPEITVSKLCDFLGVDFIPEMLEPYQEKTKRMTDGVQSASRMSGDLKFHLHRQIEPSLAYRWRKYYTVDFLSDLTWELAESFGYIKEN